MPGWPAPGGRVGWRCGRVGAHETRSVVVVGGLRVRGRPPRTVAGRRGPGGVVPVSSAAPSSSRTAASRAPSSAASATGPTSDRRSSSAPSRGRHDGPQGQLRRRRRPRRPRPARRPGRCSRPRGRPAPPARRRRSAGCRGRRSPSRPRRRPSSRPRHSTASAPCPGAGSIWIGSSTSVASAWRPSRRQAGAGEDDGVVPALGDLPQPGVDVAADRLDVSPRSRAAAGRPGAASRCRPRRRGAARRG